MAIDAGGAGQFVVREARANERAEVEALLRGAELPIEGVSDHFGQFVVALEGERLVGAAGLELYGEIALLRSTTAPRYFERRGFSLLPREALPVSLGASAELRGACPASAVALRLELESSHRSSITRGSR